MRLLDSLACVFLVVNAGGVLWAYWAIWKCRSMKGAEALVVSVLLPIPVLGLLLFLWLLRAPMPQPKGLMGNMPRGTYTHHMISLKAVLESTKSDSDQTQRGDDGKSPGDSS